MGGKQRIYQNRISSTQTLKKVFRAMELIAASRIGRARSLAIEGRPYDAAITSALAAIASHTDLDHPLTKERTDTSRVAVVVVTSDRGMAGAYSATILRETEHLLELLAEDGKEPVLFAVGRRGKSYFSFRQRAVEKSWTGESDKPSVEMMQDLSDVLLKAFLNPDPAQAVCEVYLVFTRYQNMVLQLPEVRQMLPLEIVEHDEESEDPELGFTDRPDETYSLYEFEPSAEGVLDTILPSYVSSRIRYALMQAAASELASRQRAMHTATENAQDLITNYTRLANTARQAEITQEISEIVSGADALTNR